MSEHRNLFRGKSLIWYVRFQHLGKDCKFSLRTKDERTAIRKAFLAKDDPQHFLEQQKRQRNRTKCLVENYAAAYLKSKGQVGRRDMEVRRPRIMAFVEFFRGRSLSEITPDDIRKWRDSLLYLRPNGKHLLPGTVRHYMVYVGGMVAEAQRVGISPSNPFDAVEKPRPARNLPRRRDAEGRCALIGASDAWLADFLVVGFETGMRRGELANLLKADVDLETRRAVLRHAKGGKRTVPLSPTAMEVINRVRLQIRHPYLFSGPDGMPLVRNWEDKKCEPGLQCRSWLLRKSRGSFRRMVRDSGLEFTCHDTRDTALSEWAMAGVDPLAIMAAAGHKDMSTTQRYLDLHPDYISREMEKFHARRDKAEEETG